MAEQCDPMVAKEGQSLANFTIVQLSERVKVLESALWGMMGGIDDFGGSYVNVQVDRESIEIAEKLLGIGYYRREDFINGIKPPESLQTKAYEQMSEDNIDPDYMCDREGEYIDRILEDGPWRDNT
jgi:hypothetical protein